jgi:hypothetical protein
MNKYTEESNNDILLAIKQMEHDYEALKRKMLGDYDKLMLIEKDFAMANKIITDRLKSNKV